MEKTYPVVIIGGGGVFGSRIARALAANPDLDLVLAGRAGGQGQALAATLGCRFAEVDRDQPDLDSLAPFLVIDAAGPFQSARSNDYPVACAALAAGAHYLDLSDDAAFTAGIASLDTEARGRGLTCLSGVSSVPALSAAAVRQLAPGLTDIHLIDSVILPGNRAPRGLSVVQAILAQAGQPLEEWRGGAPARTRAWGSLQRVDLGFGPRWSSPIGAPDLALFPQAFRARSVRFSAGLELSLLHLGLWALALPVRWGLVTRLTALARPLRWIADRLKGFGTDVGGMRVRVIGATQTGGMQERVWTLRAEAGDGPEVPGIPARVLTRALVEGRVAPGARPCIKDLDLADVTAELLKHYIKTDVVHVDFKPLFENAIGKEWPLLPAPLRDLHQLADCRRWTGRASITRGRTPLARLAAWLMRFPKAAPDIPVTVTMTRTGATETWVRDFGGQRFRSYLRPAPHGVTERFGPLTFQIGLTVQDGTLAYPVTRGWCLGIPMPRALLPISETVEAVDPEGRPTFDVALSHPLTGPIIRYRGWLLPA